MRGGYRGGKQLSRLVDRTWGTAYSFKEIIKDGLCWFPRLMRWQTSKGEVSVDYIRTNEFRTHLASGAVLIYDEIENISIVLDQYFLEFFFCFYTYQSS